MSLAMLEQSYRLKVRLELTYNGTVLERDVPIVDGGVTGSRDAVRRTFDCTVTEDNPAARRALWEMLTKPGMELKPYRGVIHLDGSIDEAPLGVFLVRTPKVSTTGEISLSGCPDLMQRVIDARFESPRSSRSGFTLAQQIQSLLGEAVQRLSFRSDLPDARQVPGAVWERDRLEAVQQVAIAAGGEVWVDPKGRFVLGRPPTFADKARWKFHTQGGAISTASAEVDWSSAYNIVVASGERTDGTPQVSATVRDVNPSSVTYWQGAMGPKPRFYASPFLMTKAQAEAAATTLLYRSIGARKSLTLETVANPWIDVADRVDVTLVDEGIHERHIVDSFRLPLFSAAMSLETRAVDQVVAGE